jgi:hypothetical protein
MCTGLDSVQSSPYIFDTFDDCGANYNRSPSSFGSLSLTKKQLRDASAY